MQPPNRIVAVTLIAAVGVVTGAAAIGYAFLHTRGSPQATAQAYLAAWQRGDLARMGELAVAVDGAPTGLADAYGRTQADLGISGITTRLTTLRRLDSRHAEAGFAVTLRLAAVADWSYQGRLPLRVSGQRWRVAWSPSVIHPALSAGQRLHLTTVWPPRAPILAADGSRLDTATAAGSVQQLTGVLTPASPDDLARLGLPYRAGDQVAHGGIGEQFEERLAGTPTLVVQVVDSASRPLATLARIPGRPGQPVRTSLDPRVQRAAAAAVSAQSAPTSLVAVRPSTGEVLAVANRPGGFNRGVLGQYPPGSTFKIVTAYGLLTAGLRPADSVSCPARTVVDGRAFTNFEQERLGSIDFATAFAMSCNTAFVSLATTRLDAAALTRAAAVFGFDQPLTPGLAAERGRCPPPASRLELAAAAFGQGRVVTSPLQMATVAAAVADGTWRPPRLVISPQVPQGSSPHRLDRGAAAQLRAMMGQVVSAGTAAQAGLPAGTAGKTGTAEFDGGPHPPTHAWFVGYRGDLAFAVVVEGGGVGGQTAAPLAARFLHAL